MTAQKTDTKPAAAAKPPVRRDAAASKRRILAAALKEFSDKGREGAATTYASDVPTVNQQVDKVRTARGEDTSGVGELEMAYIRKLR